MESSPMRKGPRGSLERHLLHPASTEDELLAMRQAAWLKQGVIVIRPVDVRDEWTRQAVINEANRLYGPRDTA
jgi:hypothetical protein